MKRALLFTFIILTLAACKDKDKPEPDKTAMISKKWKHVKSLGSPNSHITFNPDGTGLYEISLWSYSIDWSFINDQKGFRMRINSSPTASFKDYVIEELTEDKLKYYESSSGSRSDYEKAP